MKLLHRFVVIVCRAYMLIQILNGKENGKGMIMGIKVSVTTFFITSSTVIFAATIFDASVMPYQVYDIVLKKFSRGQKSHFCDF